LRQAAACGKVRQSYYVEPTIFYDVDNSARIARRKSWGVLLPRFISFDDEKDALKIATRQALRLAAAAGREIFSKRSGREVAARGIVWVNHMQPLRRSAVEDTSVGFGANWALGIEEYLQTKQVHINLNEQPLGGIDGYHSSCTLPFRGQNQKALAERRESPCRGDSVIPIPVYVPSRGATSKTWTQSLQSILPEHRLPQRRPVRPGVVSAIRAHSTAFSHHVQVTAYESYVRLPNA